MQSTLLDPPSELEPRDLFELLCQFRPRWPLEDTLGVGKLYAHASTTCLLFDLPA